MSLAIVVDDLLIGPAGADGLAGAPGLSPGESGKPGSPGEAGQDAALAFGNQTLAGGPGDDRVEVSLLAIGGNGGRGGAGGTGASGASTFVFSSLPGETRFTTTWTDAGSGGSGGAGGLGGLGTATFKQISLDLGNAATADKVRLAALAIGGNGGSAGASAAGGSSGATVDLESVTIIGGDPFTTITRTFGGAAGNAPDGRDGRAGRNGVVEFAAIDVTGQRIDMVIEATAVAGNGGNGGGAASGGTGSVGARGGDGGNGGNGGRAFATVSDVSVAAVLHLDLRVAVHAAGGNGGASAQGNAPGWGRETIGSSVNSSGGQTQTTTYAAAGSGGDGGDGGRAVARLLSSVFEGGSGADRVELAVSARGGTAAGGAPGSPGVQSSDVSTGTGFVQTTIVVGTASGLDGQAGRQGTAVAEIRDVTVELGAGDDVLILGAASSGDGGRKVIVKANSFAGGTGQDAIIIGNGDGQPPVLFDVAGARLRFGTNGWNAMTGFESFTGSANDDRFIDGAGDQTYRGGGGADLFVFRGGLAGHDVIADFGPDDVIRLAKFGPALDSFAEVVAAATDTPDGVLIQTGADSSILLTDVAAASLAPGMFLF